MSTATDIQLSAPEDEYAHPPRPTIPLWSENFAFVCYDAVVEIGLFIHIGRIPHNPDFWRGTTVALLPEGKLLAGKSVGLSDDAQVPSTGQLRAECETPFERWRLRHDGLALQSASAAAGSALVADRPAAQLTYDVSFERLTPIWDLTDWMRLQQWGHAHTEQAGRFRGTVSAGDSTYQLDCTGFRDHTLGPRDFANLNRTCWAHAEFPSGRVFCALRVWGPDDQVVLNQGFIFEDSQMRYPTPVELPTVTSTEGAPHEFGVTFDDGSATAGKVLHALPLMLDEPNDLLLGTDLNRAETKVIVESPCRFTWDGEVGYGWLERSRRIDQL